MRRSREKVLQPPPVKWIEERIGQMQEALGRRTERSALLLRSILGRPKLDLTQGQIGRPYYIARTSIDTLSLGPGRPGRRFEFIAMVEAAGIEPASA